MKTIMAELAYPRGYHPPACNFLLSVALCIRMRVGNEEQPRNPEHTSSSHKRLDYIHTGSRPFTGRVSHGNQSPLSRQRSEKQRTLKESAKSRDHMHFYERIKVKVKQLSRVLLFATPVDCSLPGSSVHGILQARILEWVAISFSRDLPDPGIKPASPALQADALPSQPPGKLQRVGHN